MFIKYELSEEQKELVDLVKRICEEKIKDRVRELDEKGEFPHDIIKELARADLFRIFIPEEYDGLSMGTFELCLVVEELSKVEPGIATTYAANALASTPIILFGTEEQKKKYLPQIASGEKLAAFALTEPEAGSDVSGIKTRAEKQGDSYILNGVKQWVTNGGEADIYVVFALTSPEKGARGMSAFIIEKNWEGVSFGKKEDKMGIRTSATREMILNDVKVPKENLLGREGMGFIIAMRTFERTRIGVGAQAVGIAESAFKHAVKFAKERHQFGKSISSFEGIQFMLAEMATKIESAKALVYNVAKYIDSGAKDIATPSAMAKLYASNVAMEVTTQAVQIMGGYGYMKDYPVEKLMRDAKITQIYEGTNEIQKLVISADVLKKI